MTPISFALVSADQVQDAHRIEASAYPEDEAYSYKTLAYYQSAAPSLFLGAYDQTDDNEKRLLGFICSTLSKYETYKHEAITAHDPDGKTICINSVCIDPGHQRRRIGSSLMGEYVRRLMDGPYDRFSLLAHEELFKFYAGFGFKVIGESEVAFGSKPWFELQCSLRSQIPGVVTTQRRIPEVFQEQSSQSKVRRSGEKLASYVSGGASELADGQGLNRLRLHCPRVACKSDILLEGTAAFVERSSIMIDNPQKLPPQDLLPHLPAPPESISAWKIGPPANPMVFENIGFSKTIPNESRAEPADSSRLAKLLTCAECGLGPLGWVEENLDGTSYWLVTNRVGYM